MVQTKTMAIKARVYNKIRKSLYKKRIEGFSNEQKIAFFDEIFKENTQAHWELVNYQLKRKKKKALYEARVARGYKFKKKTSLEDYKKNLEKSK